MRDAVDPTGVTWWQIGWWLVILGLVTLAVWAFRRAWELRPRTRTREPSKISPSTGDFDHLYAAEDECMFEDAATAPIPFLAQTRDMRGPR